MRTDCRLALSLLLLLPVLLAMGCISSRPPPHELTAWSSSQASATMERTMKEALAASFPRGVSMLHRVLFTIAGREFMFTGHMTVDADGNSHLLILSPLGVIAEVSRSAAGVVEVKQCTPRFRERWARKFIARDMHLLFVGPDTAGLRAAGFVGGNPVLEREDDTSLVRYVFDPRGERLTRLLTYTRARRRYETQCILSRDPQAAAGSMPTAFSVDAGRYQLEISVVRVTPLAKDES